MSELQDLIIDNKDKRFFTPSVYFSARTGICELKGESFLENTKEFYAPLIEWLKRYTTEVKKPIAFIIKLTYYNTSTSRSLLEMFNILKEYQDQGGEVIVNWHYDESDVDMKEDIEDYMIDTGLKINLIPFKPDELEE